MEKLKIIFLLSIFITTLAEETKKAPVSYARTELKVSRSLDPSSMQTLNVVTKDGQVAQLIVKRRDGKSQSTTTAAPNFEEAEKSTFQTNWVPINTLKVENEFFKAQSESQQPQIGNQINFQSEEQPKVSVPKPVTIRSGQMFVKNEETKEGNKRGRSIMQLGSDGIPVIHGVRVPDDEIDKVKVWRNARVVNGELIPYVKEDGTTKQATQGEIVYAPEPSEEEKSIGPFTTADNFAFTPQKGSGLGPFTVDEAKHSQRSNYVRFSDSNFGPFTKDDNSRFANAKLIDYIKKINEQESKRDYFTGRRYNEEPIDSHFIQRRMLQYHGTPNYPNSLLYTPQTTKLSPVNFNDGVRTPVLTYAHPELGVQPAKVPSEDDYSMKKDPYYQNYQPYDVDYMHSGRNSDRPNGYYQENEYYRRPEMSFTNYKPHYYKAKPEMPFWVRMSESLRENVFGGITRMQQMARPVFGPIMEATHKIGYNLGIMPAPTYRMDEAQDKIGEVVAPAAFGGGSVILPALGLVAGGAALGLGAAAVGRFLDVGNMRSAKSDANSELDTLEMQHKRALEKYGNPNEDIIVVMEDNQKDNSVRRRRRSVNYEEKFLEDIIQSVEHDSTPTSLGSHLIGSKVWADTPCSKRMFCDIMVQQPFEQVAFMEKKIDSYLSMVHPVLVNSLSSHLHDVMSAVKNGDCSRFICHAPKM